MILVLVYLLGLAVGIVSTFLGIGGGILIIPTLDILFPALPRQAVIATCISMIVLNSTLNLYSFKRAGKWPIGFFSLPLFLGGSIGVYVASLLTVGIAKEDLKLIFAGILTLIVVRIIFHHKDPSAEEDWNPERTKKNFLLYFAIGTLGGFIAGMTGLGGGAVLVPAFIVFLNMPSSWLSPYAQVSMISGIWGVLYYLKVPMNSSLVDSIPYSGLIVGHVHFGLVLAVFLGVLTSSRLGVKFNNTVSQKVKKNILCGFFIVVILRILIMRYM